MIKTRFNPRKLGAVIKGAKANPGSLQNSAMAVVAVQLGVSLKEIFNCGDPASMQLVWACDSDDQIPSKHGSVDPETVIRIRMPELLIEAAMSRADVTELPSWRALTEFAVSKGLGGASGVDDWMVDIAKESRTELYKQRFVRVAKMLDRWKSQNGSRCLDDDKSRYIITRAILQDSVER